MLEPVNVRVDHPGSLLDRTAEAVYVARGVDSPYFGVLYDIYHSAVEGEDMAAELANAGDLIKYVQLADAPGRGEPGTGDRSTGRPRSRILRALRLRRPDRARVLPDDRRRRSRCSSSASWRRTHERARLSRHAVDVAIVGSGPAGAAYARILSEQAPDATIAMFEVGPTVVQPPGRARQEHRGS